MTSFGIVCGKCFRSVPSNSSGAIISCGCILCSTCSSFSSDELMTCPSCGHEGARSLRLNASLPSEVAIKLSDASQNLENTFQSLRFQVKYYKVIIKKLLQKSGKLEHDCSNYKRVITELENKLLNQSGIGEDFQIQRHERSYARQGQSNRPVHEVSPFRSHSEPRYEPPPPQPAPVDYSSRSASPYFSPAAPTTNYISLDSTLGKRPSGYSHRQSEYGNPGYGTTNDFGGYSSDTSTTSAPGFRSSFQRGSCPGAGAPHASSAPAPPQLQRPHPYRPQSFSMRGRMAGGGGASLTARSDDGGVTPSSSSPYLQTPPHSAGSGQSLNKLTPSPSRAAQMRTSLFTPVQNNGSSTSSSTAGVPPSGSDARVRVPHTPVLRMQSPMVAHSKGVSVNQSLHSSKATTPTLSVYDHPY